MITNAGLADSAAMAEPNPRLTSTTGSAQQTSVVREPATAKVSVSQSLISTSPAFTPRAGRPASQRHGLDEVADRFRRVGLIWHRGDLLRELCKLRSQPLQFLDTTVHFAYFVGEKLPYAAARRPAGVCEPEDFADLGER